MLGCRPDSGHDIQAEYIQYLLLEDDLVGVISQKISIGRITLSSPPSIDLIANTERSFIFPSPHPKFSDHDHWRLNADKQQRIVSFECVFDY